MLKPHHIPELSSVLIKALKSPVLIFLALLGNAIMLFAAYGFYKLEREVNPQVDSYGDALWWAICTVSTVGYGDIVPITGLGRVIGAILIIFGVMFFLTWTAVLAGLISSFISPKFKSRSKEQK